MKKCQIRLTTGKVQKADGHALLVFDETGEVCFREKLGPFDGEPRRIDPFLLFFRQLAVAGGVDQVVFR